jgi:hypothetical protein
MTAPMTEREELLALANEYEAGLNRALSSGYEEFGPTWARRQRLVIDALRGAAQGAALDREQIAAVLYIKRFPHRTWQTASLTETTLAYEQADALQGVLEFAHPLGAL